MTFQMQASTDFGLTEAQWWRSVASQMRDLSANANESPVQSAQALRRWAESRKNDAAFAAHVDAALVSSAVTMAANKPRRVR